MKHFPGRFVAFLLLNQSSDTHVTAPANYFLVRNLSLVGLDPSDPPEMSSLLAGGKTLAEAAAEDERSRPHSRLGQKGHAVFVGGALFGFLCLSTSSIIKRRLPSRRRPPTSRSALTATPSTRAWPRSWLFFKRYQLITGRDSPLYTTGGGKAGENSHAGVLKRNVKYGRGRQTTLTTSIQQL